MAGEYLTLKAQQSPPYYGGVTGGVTGRRTRREKPYFLPLLVLRPILCRWNEPQPTQL